MRIGRAYEQHGKCVPRRGVVGVAAATGQEPAILASLDRLAELEGDVHAIGYTGFAAAL